MVDPLNPPADASILDPGCGTGEISMRLAQTFPGARLLGVDVIDAHLERARARSVAFGDRVRFEHRSIFELDLPDRTFELVVCRHVLQAIPHPERVIAELARVTKRSGWLSWICRTGPSISSSAVTCCRPSRTLSASS